MLYKVPIIQVICTTLLNFGYLVMLVSIRPFNNQETYIKEVVNEAVILITLYLLMCFSDQFIGEVE
jgi:hypothetical protein